MKGTEKQIKWAEDIISETRESLSAHIAYCREKAAGTEIPDFWQRDAHIWEAISAEYERTISQIDSAAVVIDNRKLLDSARMQWYFNEISTGHLPGFPGV